ncbi:MAG: hypothetical protein IT458_02735 [Planctomycetes bacterium]|nr:hypothetical protein [Planctomycetota bacterium]
MTTTPSPLQLRIDSLEHTCRRMRRAGATALLLCAALPLLAFLPARNAQDPARGPEVLRAGSFELTDKSGAVRARLGFDKEGGPELRLFDARGRVRVRVCIHKDEQPLVTLVDEEDKNRLSLAYDGNPHLVLSQPGGKPVAHLTAGATGAASLLFTHKDGMHNAGLGIHVNGDGFLIQRKQEAKQGK